MNKAKCIGIFLFGLIALLLGLFWVFSPMYENYEECGSVFLCGEE